MISLKSTTELAKMRDAGKISAQALIVAGEHCKAGVTTKEIDTAVRKFILKQGATPSFLNYQGFPASACISVNDMIIHGIPSSNTVLKEGDIVSVDVGALYNGFHGDNAFTFKVGEVSQDAQGLLDITQKALYAGIEKAIAGNRIGDISSAIEETVTPGEYGIVKEFVGHGIGREMHEEPEIPNYGKAGRGPRLMPGMVIAIEPMINSSGDEIKKLDDGWGIVTANESLSAHFEHTVAITNDGPIILTKA